MSEVLENLCGELNRRELRAYCRGVALYAVHKG